MLEFKESKVALVSKYKFHNLNPTSTTSTKRVCCKNPVFLNRAAARLISCSIFWHHCGMWHKCGCSNTHNSSTNSSKLLCRWARCGRDHYSGKLWQQGHRVLETRVMLKKVQLVHQVCPTKSHLFCSVTPIQQIWVEFDFWFLDRAGKDYNVCKVFLFMQHWGE